MGNDEVSDKEKRVVFVTVGTTCFDALVRAVDSNIIKQALFAKGYTHLLIQMGRGSYIPSKVLSPFLFLSLCFLIRYFLVENFFCNN